MTPSDSPATTSIMDIHRQLRDLYGDPPHRPDGDPLAALVNTILSQNTNDRNRDIAFAALRAQFPELESVVSRLEPIGDGSVRRPGVECAVGHVARVLEEISAEIRIGFHPHDLQVHRSEGRISVSFHCRLHPSARLRDAHEFSGDLERRLRLRMPEIDRVIIHAEPTVGPGSADADAGLYQDGSGPKTASGGGPHRRPGA